MNGPFDIDLEALRSSVLSVEHMLVRFTPVSERLLLDFRTVGDEGPEVVLLPQVSSFTERLKTIKDARPEFPRPERIHVVSWPLRIASLERLGVLEAIRARLAGMDAFDVIGRVDEAYQRLLELESDEIQKAISGDGYHTIWPTEDSSS